MQFTTPVPVKSQEPKIDHNSRIFLVGSCFVENIGDKLDYFKLPSNRNPFGILYHPAAIEKFLRKADEGYTYTHQDIFIHNERWHCFDAHSSLSDPNKDQLLRNLNDNLEKTENYLKEASHVVITLGTSWGYKTSITKEPVANCHKLPQKNFSKENSGVEELQDLLRSMISSIQNINSEAVVIFTISPVRHIKDGIVENQLSKAQLITAVHNVISESPEKKFYFPAYEIMMDELRDYRFYAEDMLHPNATAIQFIWSKFISSWLSPEAIITLEQVEEIQKGLAHKPFNEFSEAHRKFLQNLQEKEKNLRSRYPNIIFNF